MAFFFLNLDDDPDPLHDEKHDRWARVIAWLPAIVVGVVVAGLATYASTYVHSHVLDGVLMWVALIGSAIVALFVHYKVAGALTRARRARRAGKSPPIPQARTVRS
jgi:hypothetical protein